MIRNVTFTCPHGREDRCAAGGVSDPYRSVTCPACGWSHLVDPNTGVVLVRQISNGQQAGLLRRDADLPIRRFDFLEATSGHL